MARKIFLKGKYPRNFSNWDIFLSMAFVGDIFRKEHFLRKIFQKIGKNWHSPCIESKLPQLSGQARAAEQCKASRSRAEGCYQKWTRSTANNDRKLCCEGERRTRAHKTLIGLRASMFPEWACAPGCLRRRSPRRRCTSAALRPHTCRSWAGWRCWCWGSSHASSTWAGSFRQPTGEWSCWMEIIPFETCRATRR